MIKPQAVFVELGHGGRNWRGTIDKGASCHGENERDLLKPVAIETLRLLKEEGLNTYDVGIFTKARSKDKVKYINKVVTENKYKWYECFCFSLHLNSINGYAEGIECWIPQQAEKGNLEYKLAREIIKQNIKFYKQPNRLVKQKILYINDLKPYSVLIEFGFLQDEKFVFILKENPKKFARILVEVYLEFLKNN